VAVYTHVGDAQMHALVAEYDIGRLVKFCGIEQGVENSNYDVTTSRGRFVLTLFEKRVSRKDIPFFLGLMAHLAGKGLLSPQPVMGRDGKFSREVCGKAAILATFLPGAQRMTPSAEDCAKLGAFAAELHIAAADFELRRANDLGLAGWIRLAAKCASGADACAPGLSGLISEEIAFLQANWPKGLPAGDVHADLFPDNIFFEGERISGVIDFYFACTDFFAYDLAICLNSWAQTKGAWDAPRETALIGGYETRRALSPDERAAMPILLRGAALRFLLTRLHDFLHQVEGAVVRVKDPLEYRDLLLSHRAGRAWTR
jgi:homoserine kinase type II